LRGKAVQITHRVYTVVADEIGGAEPSERIDVICEVAVLKRDEVGRQRFHHLRPVREQGTILILVPTFPRDTH
jgi:hypothetical protein